MKIGALMQSLGPAPLLRTTLLDGEHRNRQVCLAFCMDGPSSSGCTGPGTRRGGSNGGARAQCYRAHVDLGIPKWSDADPAVFQPLVAWLKQENVKLAMAPSPDLQNSRLWS